MAKRFHEKYQQTPKLDLHGLKHREVFSIVEDFILEKQYDLPALIITGNSIRMKTIVINVLKEYNFNYSEGDLYNRGYITVLN
tara:strand:+ start:356 stop:604 length:249 start_codon:yes stop_codon:yes gene_type:complete